MIFTALVDAAEWIIKRAGTGFVIHYLDDFLVMGAPECSIALGMMLDVFHHLGAVEKLEGPTPCPDRGSLSLNGWSFKL